MLREVAQEIAESASGIIGHGVILTDERGVVIGASDPSRLGQRHGPSLDCLQSGRLEVTDEAQAREREVLPGVTVPVSVAGRYVGTLAISGPPEEVARYGRLVQSQAEILLREQALTESTLLREQALRDLVREIGALDPLRSGITPLLTRGRELGVDLRLPRRALALEVRGQRPCGRGPEDRAEEGRILEALREAFPHPQDLRVGLGECRFALLVLEGREGSSGEDRVEERARWLLATLKGLGWEAFAGMGHPAAGPEGLPGSWEEALEALDLGLRLGRGPGLYPLRDWAVESALLSAAPSRLDRLVRDTLPSRAARDREELARTFLAWCESPFAPGEVARRLHLHRNTLAYRLDRIRRLTGLDPRDFRQAFRLYLALIARELREGTPRERGEPDDHAPGAGP